jgi:predicted transcriptional regulator YheO
MENDMMDEFMDFIKKLAGLTAGTFGKNCEVVISELDRPEPSVLAIFNGHVTGRSAGDPLSPRALERVRRSEGGCYINREEGRNDSLLKSSTVSGRIGGHSIAFCINYEYTFLETLKDALNEFLSSQNSWGGEQPHSQPAEAIMEEALRRAKKPVRLMNKKDRLEVISYLEKNGFLQMQKSVQAIARCLGISRYTVYNYLNELKTGQGAEQDMEIDADMETGAETEMERDTEIG